MKHLLATVALLALISPVHAEPANVNLAAVKTFYGPVVTGKWRVFGNAYLDHARTNACVAATDYKDGSRVEIVRDLDKKAQVYISIHNVDWNIRAKPGTTFSVSIVARDATEVKFFSETGTAFVFNAENIVLPNMNVDGTKRFLIGASGVTFRMPGIVQDIGVQFSSGEGQDILDQIGECVKKAYLKDDDDRRKSL
jgi:hypothetical protein